MSDWWLDLAGNLVGTFVGALLALVSGWWLRRSQQHRDDVRLLQNLIDGLHHRRALRPVSGVGGGAPEGNLEDRQRCADSVLAARRRIAEAADRLLVDPDARPHLADMRTACNRWLSAETRQPDQYVTALMTLRAELLRLERLIVDQRPKLVLREPGVGALLPSVPTV